MSAKTYPDGWADDLEGDALSPPWEDARPPAAAAVKETRAVCPQPPMARPSPSAKTSAFEPTVKPRPPQHVAVESIESLVASAGKPFTASGATPSPNAQKVWGAPPQADAAGAPIPGADRPERSPAMAHRSGLFRVGTSMGVMFEGVELACFEKDRRVVYTGPKLTMDDKQVWEVALAEGKRRGAGKEFLLPARRVAKAVGKTLSGPGTSSIAESFKRLAQAVVHYNLPGGVSGSGRLLGSARQTSAGWSISIDAGLIPAFGEDKQFEIATSRRARLPTDLARWLHDFISTHAKGTSWTFELEELADLCGSQADSHFPARLEAALNKLRETCPEVLESFEIVRHHREWTSWQARVVKGAEQAKFGTPAEEERKALAKKDKSAARNASQGGRGPAGAAKGVPNRGGVAL